MTPDNPQLTLLIKAFTDLQPKQRARHLFVAGNQTHAVADFRRAADKAGGEIGEALHALLDALEQRDADALRIEQEKVRELTAVLDGMRARVGQALKHHRAYEFGKAFALLKEMREELKVQKAP